MANEKRRRFGGGDGAVTPPDELPTPENTARYLARLCRYLQGVHQLGERLGKIVVEGGFDARAIAVMEEAIDQLEDLSDISAGTGLSLRRFLKSLSA